MPLEIVDIHIPFAVAVAHIYARFHVSLENRHTHQWNQWNHTNLEILGDPSDHMPHGVAPGSKLE